MLSRTTMADQNGEGPNRHDRRVAASAERRGLSAVLIDDRGDIGFYSKPEVCRLTTFTPTTLWRRIRAGDFPPAVQLSPNRVGWPKQAVHDWITRKTGEAESAAQGSAAAKSATET